MEYCKTCGEDLHYDDYIICEDCLNYEMSIDSNIVKYIKEYDLVKEFKSCLNVEEFIFQDKSHFIDFII